MTVNFTELLENAELTEDVKSALQEAWEGKISEAREELTAELREEFAQRYEHDKSQIVEAVDNFISEKVEGCWSKAFTKLKLHNTMLSVHVHRTQPVAVPSFAVRGLTFLVFFFLS